MPAQGVLRWERPRSSVSTSEVVGRRAGSPLFEGEVPKVTCMRRTLWACVLAVVILALPGARDAFARRSASPAP